jgi:glutamate-1-semialdehyde 2,1-aminomutase
VEPVAGNMNLILPKPGFLEGLRKLCSDHGTLLIFDEVMCGFRVALGGAQEYSGVTPDLSAFGKVIGGGMPVGAIGGPALVMDMMAPLGPVYQAGTLSGNPIAMAAGLATLKLIRQPGFFERISSRCAHLVSGLNDAGADVKRTRGIDFCAKSLGAMAGVFMRATPPESFAEVQTQNVERFKQFYHLMLDEGIYLPPSPVEAFFFSSAHSDQDMDDTIAAARRSLAKLS